MANRKRLIVGLSILFAGLMLNGCGPSTAGIAEFHRAIREGNLNEMESMLAKKPGLLNVRMEAGWSSKGELLYVREIECGSSALFLAASRGDKEMAEFLIENGAEVNNKRKGCIYMPSPLHRAAYGGHKEVVELLIANGADVMSRESLWEPLEGDKDQTKYTALDIAIRKGHEDVVELLRKAGAASEIAEPATEAVGAKAEKPEAEAPKAPQADETMPWWSPPGLSTEGSEERMARMRERWEDMSEEQRERFRAGMRERKERWENMSEEERQEFLARMRERRERWESMSEEERQEYRARRREEREE